MFLFQQLEIINGRVSICTKEVCSYKLLVVRVSGLLLGVLVPVSGGIQQPDGVHLVLGAPGFNLVLQQ